jgi:hypothetical protein
MVVHEGFVEAGYLTPRPGWRMHAAYLNPARSSSPGSTGTPSHCALIADGPFGLPTAPSRRRTTRCGGSTALYEAGSAVRLPEHRRSTCRS